MRNRQLAAIIAFVTAVPALSADWPGWRGPARNGISPETGLNWQWPAEGPEVLWKASVGTGFSCIAVAGRRAYKLGNRDNIDTVYLSNCVLWQGSLYGFDDKELQCLDWQTGEVRWSSPRLGLGSLILAEGKLIVLQENGTLRIVEATPEAYRSLAEAKTLTGRCWSAPSLADGRLYLRNAAGDVLCLDLRKWKAR